MPKMGVITNKKHNIPKVSGVFNTQAAKSLMLPLSSFLLYSIVTFQSNFDTDPTYIPNLYVPYKLHKHK